MWSENCLSYIGRLAGQELKSGLQMVLFRGPSRGLSWAAAPVTTTSNFSESLAFTHQTAYFLILFFYIFLILLEIALMAQQ